MDANIVPDEGKQDEFKFNIKLNPLHLAHVTSAIIFTMRKVLTEGEVHAGLSEALAIIQSQAGEKSND